MKKIFLLAFLIIGLGCSNNEDNDPSNGGPDVVNDQAGDSGSGCQTPGNLFVDDVTTTSVRANWDDVNSSQLFNVEYGVRGFNVGSGNRVSSNIPNKVISGLTTGTEYDFYVRANCGGNVYSNWAGPHSFVTN